MCAGNWTAEGPQSPAKRTAEGPQGRVGSATPPNIGLPHGSRSLRVIPFSTVARCGVLPGEDDRLREENKTLIDGAAVSVGVRPMLML